MQPNTLAPKVLSALSLGSGVIGLVFLLVFFFSMVGASFLTVAAILGVLAIILGIVALAKRQSKGLALTGLILGAVTTLLALGVFVFALLFVGAFTGM
ncbi:MAG: hypothetical protein ACTHZ9_08765 [Leucobacter sp.]